MASQRLTNVDREYIVKNIANPISKKIKNLLDEYGEKFVTPYLQSQYPKEVMDFYREYPFMIETRDTLCYTDLKDARNFEGIYIPVKDYLVDWFKNKINIYKELRKFATTQELIKKVEELIKERTQIKNRTKCILYDQINTTKQLKEQFPEAYDVLMNMEGEAESNACDKIENLRASLSKYKDNE